MTLIYRLRNYTVTTQYLQEVQNRRKVVYYAILLLLILGELLGEINYIIIIFLEYDSLPQNRKGYIISDSWNLLKVYVSRDVTFVETPEISGCIMIQVDEQVSESEEAPMNNVEAKPESESEAEDLVVEGDDAGQKSEARDATETTVEDTPTQLR